MQEERDANKKVRDAEAYRESKVKEAESSAKQELDKFQDHLNDLFNKDERFQQGIDVSAMDAETEQELVTI